MFMRFPKAFATGVVRNFVAGVIFKAVPPIDVLVVKAAFVFCASVDVGLESICAIAVDVLCTVAAGTSCAGVKKGLEFCFIDVPEYPEGVVKGVAFVAIGATGSGLIPVKVPCQGKEEEEEVKAA